MSANSIWSGSKSFSIPAGEATLVPISMPHRGILRGYSLVEAAGGATGNFTAALYTSNRATEPNSNLPEDAFKLFAFDQTKAADEEVDVSYLNRDGTPTLPQRYLYLKITPAGSGTKNYVFSVTVRNFL
jgi:hypothetical protein